MFIRESFSCLRHIGLLSIFFLNGLISPANRVSLSTWQNSWWTAISWRLAFPLPRAWRARRSVAPASTCGQQMAVKSGARKIAYSPSTLLLGASQVRVCYYYYSLPFKEKSCWNLFWKNGILRAGQASIFCSVTRATTWQSDTVGGGGFWLHAQTQRQQATAVWPLKVSHWHDSCCEGFLDSIRWSCKSIRPL